MSRRRHVHSAFGLAVHADVELPRLAPGNGGSRVDVQVGEPVERPPTGTGMPAFVAGMERVWRSREGWLLRYDDPRNDDAWAMRIPAGGDAIELERTRGIPLPDALEVLQSVGLVSALQLRGVLLLHGCVVEVGGRAILVLGASGAGKSTVAATLVRDGHALLDEDIAAVEALDGGLVVRPGLRRLRVLPGTARALGWDPDALPRAFETPLLGDKRRVELSAATGSFCPETREIAAVFVLGPRTSAPATRLASLQPGRALAALRAHGYRDGVLDPDQRAARFPLLVRLAREVPVHGVRARDDYAALPDLVDALLARSPV